MAMNRFYEEFSPMQPQNTDSLLDAIKWATISDKHLNMKTQIENPPVWTAFDVFAQYLDDVAKGKDGKDFGAKLMKKFSHDLKEQMVSYKRQGKIEHVNMVSSAIQGMMQHIRSFGERLAGTGKNP